MGTKTFTIADFIDAIEKNGLPRTTGRLFEFDLDDNIIKACALGQALINLGIQESWGTYTEDNIWYRINHATGATEHGAFSNNVILLNDFNNFPLDKIARTLRERFKDYLNNVVHDIPKGEYPVKELVHAS